MARRYRKGPLRLADAAKPALAAYPWPGNVRELENTIERAVVLCQGSAITVRDLGLEPRRTTGVIGAQTAGDSWIGMPAFGGAAAAAAPAGSAPGPAPGEAAITLPSDLPLEEAERRYARAILERCENNQSAAARALGISRNKLARLLRG